MLLLKLYRKGLSLVLLHQEYSMCLLYAILLQDESPTDCTLKVLNKLHDECPKKNPKKYHLTYLQI